MTDTPNTQIQPQPQRNPGSTSRWMAPLICMVGFILWHLAFWGATGILAVEHVLPFAREWGPIENAQKIVLTLLIIVTIAYAWRVPSKWPWLAVVLAGLLLFREMDAHKLYAGESIWKLTFYTRFDAPVWIKLMAGLFTLSAIGVLITFLIRHASIFLTGLWAGQQRTWVVAMGFGSIVVSKLADSFHRTLSFIELSAGADQWRMVYEEAMELTAYVLLLTVALIWFRRMHSTAPNSR